MIQDVQKEVSSRHIQVIQEDLGYAGAKWCQQKLTHISAKTKGKQGIQRYKNEKEQIIENQNVRKWVNASHIFTKGGSKVTHNNSGGPVVYHGD